MKVYIVCALLFFAANSSIKPNGKRQQSNSETDTKTESPIIVVDNRSAAEQTDQRQNEARGWDASVGANWALVIVGIATFIAVWKQAKETAKATQAMRDSIPLQQKTAAAAENAVQTADKALKLQEDTAKRQLRAYVVLKRARLFLHPDGSVEPKFELDNCGQTPAYSLEGAYHGRFESYPVATGGTPPDGIRKSISVIGAGRQFHGLGEILDYHRMALPGLLNRLGRDDFVCCMNGYFTYRDIFNESHFLKFQVIVGGPSGVRTGVNRKGEQFAAFCNDSTGNEAD